MVKITNGIRITTVTHGAFKELYEPNGWQEVEESVPALEEGPMREDIDDGELPLSEMKTSELRQFAEDHNIDVSEAKNKREIIRLIRKAQESEEE